MLAICPEHLCPTVAFHLLIHPFGGAPEGHSRKAIKLPLRKKFHAPFPPGPDVDLAFFQTLQQIIGRQVNQLYFIRPARKESGSVSRTTTPVICFTISLRLSRCCTLTWCKRNACAKQLLDVLPALLMSDPGTFEWASSSTTIREGCAAELHRGQTPDLPASIGKHPTRQDFEALKKAAVSFLPCVSAIPTTISMPSACFF